MPLPSEKFRKLDPIDKNTDLLWLLYLSGEEQDRKKTDELIDILLHQKAKKDFREKILMDPGHREVCAGDYALGPIFSE